MKTQKFQVEFRPSVYKELARIDRRYLPKIWEKIEALGDEPTPRGSLKLSGADKVHRIRLGVFRIFYEIEYESRTVIITHILHRQSAYKKK